MTEMVERVAKALEPKCAAFGPGDTPRLVALEFARAAIEAMREPTLTMLYEGEGMCDYIMPEGFENTRESRQAELRCGWQTMIDAALAPASPTPSRKPQSPA